MIRVFCTYSNENNPYHGSGRPCGCHGPTLPWSGTENEPHYMVQCKQYNQPHSLLGVAACQTIVPRQNLPMLMSHLCGKYSQATCDPCSCCPVRRCPHNLAAICLLQQRHSNIPAASSSALPTICSPLSPSSILSPPPRVT